MLSSFKSQALSESSFKQVKSSLHHDRMKSQEMSLFVTQIRLASTFESAALLKDKSDPTGLLGSGWQLTKDLTCLFAQLKLKLPLNIFQLSNLLKSLDNLFFGARITIFGRQGGSGENILIGSD